jgi:hypothetical protein
MEESMFKDADIPSALQMQFHVPMKPHDCDGDGSIYGVGDLVAIRNEFFKPDEKT